MSLPESKDVAIDTNVFEHLFNENTNVASHIETLLIALQKLGYGLCVDDKDKISKEYRKELKPIIAKAFETDFQRYLLTYWLNYAPRVTIEIDLQGLLLHRIAQVIPEPSESVDRMFVAVACAADCKLVTNDNRHILNRKAELRRKTRKLRGKNTDFISSQDACNEFVTPLP